MKTSITIAYQVHFCAGHRLLHHEHRCSSMHGHNYSAQLYVTSPHLDNQGRVIDFSELKKRLGSWIDQHWDHAFICYREDAEVRSALAQISQQRIYLLDQNPTAENLALHLLHQVGPTVLQDTSVRLTRVVLWETANCCADISLESSS